MKQFTTNVLNIMAAGNKKKPKTEKQEVPFIQS